MKRIPRIDWNRIILDLSARGYSLRLIGVEIEVHHSTVGCWKNVPGTEPKYNDALRLIELWSDVTGRSPAELPAILEA